MGAEVTIYNDGSGPDIEVVAVRNADVPPEKTVLDAGDDPRSSQFKLRKGDILIVRVVE